jgi:CTP synthase (UTP-ammonia lyase)
MAAKTIRIGVLGDFNPAYHSHRATNASIEHAAQMLGINAGVEWVPTPELLEPHAEKTLAQFDGLWASPGSPYKSMAGMLLGIQRARLGTWPFLAT